MILSDHPPNLNVVIRETGLIVSQSSLSFFHLLMKWSIYNEIIQSNNKEYLILFNLLKEKYFALNVELKDLVSQTAHNIATIENIHPELYKQLVLEGFIVPQEADEVDECIQKLNYKFKSNSELRITINPTLDCNLRCWYCYESRIKGSCMTSDTINAIIAYVEKQCQSSEIEKILLSFFGGEPLLKYNKVIKPLVYRCYNLCISYNKVFALHFTTNGVCLTSTVVDELLSMGINFSIQVAFDGNKNMHDAVKRFSNGIGCYDIVRKHLNYAIERGVRTTIRCNYTKTNIESFIDLINDFKSYWHQPNIRFSFHKVWQEPESEELFHKREKMKNFIEEIGVVSNINSFYGNSLVPCYADFDNNVVFNYNGEVFKCTARDFSPEHRLGYLDIDGTITYLKRSTSRIEEKLTKQCKACRLLPICTICFQQRKESSDGTCPTPALFENASTNIKKYFQDTIKLQRQST